MSINLRIGMVNIIHRRSIMRSIKAIQQALDCRWKLNADQRREIIDRRINAHESQASLANAFGVHQSTISRLVSDHLRQQAEEKENHE